MDILRSLGPRAGLPCLLLLTLGSVALATDRPRTASELPAAQAPPPPLPEGAIAAALAEERPRVHFDEPGDGALWARGGRWKMSFDPEGADYFASFGPTLPSQELRFAPARVSLAGSLLPHARSAVVSRDGNRVELDRGSFVEAYELAPDSVEQLFVFHELPRRGELEMHISVQGDFTPASRSEGLEFRGPHGSVAYSRAVAIDAAGRRVEAETTFGPEGIRIRVDAEFVAGAALPLVIDPFIGQTALDSTTKDTREPDAVWDEHNMVWLVVYHEVFSATDNDIRARTVSSSGALYSDGYIDFTSTTWSRPRIAYVRADTRCLVVAEVGAVGGRIVRGRTVKPNGTILEFGAQFTISGAHTGEKFAPTVGGDPHPSQPSYFCVAFQREIPSSVITHELHYALVNTAGQVVLGPTALPSAGGFGDSLPSLSRSNGAVRWTLAFQRFDTLTFGDIYALYISRTGTAEPAFGISAFGIPRDTAPCASSPLVDTSWSAVAFERRNSFSSQPDVIVAAIRDGVVTDIVNISTLENSGTGPLAQLAPSIDSDGVHFLVAYSEFVPGFLYDELMVSELFLSGDKFGIHQPHQEVFPLGLTQRGSKVAGRRVNPNGPNHFMIVNHIRGNDTDYDVNAVRWGTTAGGSWNPFCFGDGSGSSCPCGLDGVAGHGCPNSAWDSGALLEVYGGVLSVLNDTAVLTASSMPPGQFCLFFQGTSELAGTPLGEGLHCAGGAIIRMAVKPTGPIGVANFPSWGDPTLSAAGAVPPGGAMRTYQVWYRDTDVFCGSANNNLTNGVRVLWGL